MSYFNYNIFRKNFGIYEWHCWKEHIVLFQINSLSILPRSAHTHSMASFGMESPDYKRNVSIIMDEKKVNSELVFSSGGMLIGFCDVGDINNELKTFEEDIHGEKTKLASHAFVLMVRGLFSNRKAPFAYFPCESVPKPNVIPVCGTVLSCSNAGIFMLGVLPRMEPAVTGSSMKDGQRSAVLKTGHGTLRSMRERFIMDEMKVKSGLVFSSDGMLIGFCNVGDINNELKMFEEHTHGEKTKLASHVFVLRVRGPFSNLKAPFAYFPCESVT